MIKRLLVGVVGVVCFSVWAFGQSCTVQVYFASPGTGDGVMAVLLQSIDGARETLEIAVASLADDRLGDAVVRAHRRGVSVRVILAGGREGEISGEYEKLLSAGLPVRLSGGSGSFGHRFAIVDRRIVLTGSYEWTDHSLAKTFDSLVRITCPTVSLTYLGEFDSLWALWGLQSSAALTSASSIASVSILSVDRASQCITLLNSSDRAVDLSYWSLNDLEGQYTFPAGSEIPSNDPYRICIEVFNPTNDVDGLYLGPEDDELFLATPEGDIVDEVVW